MTSDAAMHTLDELLEGMASPDPAVRDGWAYDELSAGILEGRFADRLDHVIQVATDRLTHPAPWARSFGALILAWVASVHELDQNACDTFSSWYVAEEDTRGFDDKVGWIHPVAHGADLLVVLAHRCTLPAAHVLDVIAHRLVGPGEAWHHQEDARLTRAIVRALGQLPAAAEPAWLDVVRERMDALEAAGEAGGPPPAWVHNSSITCAKAYLALSSQRDGRVTDPLLGRTLDGLREIVLRMEPYLVR